METRRAPGRPRSFDREAGLDAAARVFWRDGYEGATLAALTAAMGVSPPSLYAAFGDKRALFLEAMGRYLPLPEAEAAIASAPSARAAAERLLEGAVERFTGADTPAGCLVARAGGAAGVAAEVAAARRAVEAALAERARRDLACGVLPPDADPEALAGLVAATVQGLAVQAREGASRPMLRRIAAQALAAWPDGARPPAGDARET